MGFWKRLFGGSEGPGATAQFTAGSGAGALPVLRVDPGVSSPRILGGHDGHVWVAGAHRSYFVALDPDSGAEVDNVDLALPHELAFGLSAQRSSGVWIVESKDEVAGYEAASDRRLWRVPRPDPAFRLVCPGATPFASDDRAALFWASSQPDGVELLRMEPRTGALARIAWLPARPIDLFLPLGDRVLVGDAEHGLTAFDAEVGATLWTAPLPADRRGDGLVGPVVVGDRAFVGIRSWQGTGPVALLTPLALDGRGAGAPIRVDGALDWIAASGSLLAVATTHPTRERVVTALIPGGPSAELVVPEALGPIAFCTDEEAIVVIASGGRLALAQLGPSGVAWTEAPLPEGVSPYGALAGGVAACTHGHDVLLADTRPLREIAARRPRWDARVARRPAAAPPAGGEEAEVVSAGASAVVLLSHPRLGRIPLTVPAGVRRPLVGEKVVLDEITEHEDDVIEVHRWRVVGAVEVEAGLSEELPASWPDPPRDKPPVKGDLVERLGDRTVPELFRRIATRLDDDPVFRWLSEAATGLRWRIDGNEAGLDALWQSGAMPFASDESGCLYGIGERVVAFDPEAEGVLPCAETLDDFLRERLQASEELVPASVAVFRTEMGL